MWSLWTKAKTYHKLPSEVFGEKNGLAAWMLDNAVTWFGITIENALAERINTGTQKQPRWEARYTLSQLLDSDFRLPRPERPRKAQSGLAELMAMAGKPGSGVGRYQYVGPETVH